MILIITLCIRVNMSETILLTVMSLNKDMDGRVQLFYLCDCRVHQLFGVRIQILPCDDDVAE